MERAIPWGIFVVLMTAACFWRPRPMRAVVGVFFALMGLGVHGAFIATDPQGYVAFARQALVPAYARLAETVVVSLGPTTFGIGMLLFEVTLAALMLGKGRSVNAALVVGVLFLVGITPLGVEVLPNAILAIGLGKLARGQYPMGVLEEFRAWRASRRGGAERVVASGKGA